MSDNIFQQYLTPPKSVMDYGAEMDQADARRSALQQNALTLAAGQQQLAAAQREREGENHLSRLLSAGSTPDQVAAGLAQAGYGKQALAYTKQQSDLAKATADTAHIGAQTGKLASETTKLDYDQREAKRQKAITDIAAFTDAQQAATSLNLHIQAGDIDPAQGQMIMQTIPKNPADFAKWQIGMLQRIMSAKDSAGQIAPDANTVASNAQSDINSKRTAATAAAGQAAENARSAKSRETQLLVSGLNQNGAPSSDVESMAQAIAAGKLAPINGFALARPRGQAIMARAMEINPNYDAGDYAAKNNALKGFSTGKEGTALRSFNVATDHLKTLGDMTVALNNGNNQFFNQAANYYAEKTGSPAPTNFDAVKEIVGKEVVKAIVAGGGGVAEREELSNLLGKVKSPEQLSGVIGHFTELMGAQRDGLMDQYQRTTGRTDGATVFAPAKRAPKASAPGDIHAAADAILRGGK